MARHSDVHPTNEQITLIAQPGREILLLLTLDACCLSVSFPLSLSPPAARRHPFAGF
jgi:hypothetical protein